jgi:hypothetical protein
MQNKHNLRGFLIFLEKVDKKIDGGEGDGGFQLQAL